MEEQEETYAGIGSTVYVFRKDDLQDGASFDDLKEKAVTLDASPHNNLVFVTDDSNTKKRGFRHSFSLSGEVEFPLEIPIDTSRSLFGLDDDDTQHIKADVEFKTREGKRYFVKDADIEINVCPVIPHRKPLLWDKLPCDMLTQLCHPLRWGDKHFNRRIYHYQWMKRNNYL